MKIPNNIKIGGKTYNVVIENDKRVSKDGYLLGEIDYTKHEIYLYGQLNETEMQICFIHEVLHGVFYLLGNRKLGKNEDFINSLSENLYQILNENKDWIES